MGLGRWIVAAAVAAGAATSASAGEGLFSRVYTTDLTPKATFEFEQVVREREGRSFGRYDATDFRTEIEYGVTDDLQASLYLNTSRVGARGAPDDDDPNGITGFTRHRFALSSVSGEFIYRLVSPYKNRHGWGLAVYLEPEYALHDIHNGLAYGAGTASLEGRVIVQKNFLDDRLVLTYNLVLEGETIRFAGQTQRTGELDWNNEAGVSYRFAPKLFAGLEVRNHNEYGNFHRHEHSVVWAGPVVHYGGRRAWATLGFLRQVYGDPSGVDDTARFIGDGLFLRSHEKNEITFKLGVPF